MGLAWVGMPVPLEDSGGPPVEEVTVDTLFLLPMLDAGSASYRAGLAAGASWYAGAS